MNDLKITHHYQNQKFNNIHEFFWGFGSSFHTVYAVVPLFLKELGAPEVIATSSAGIFSIIIALPSPAAVPANLGLIDIMAAVAFGSDIPLPKPTSSMNPKKENMEPHA